MKTHLTDIQRAMLAGEMGPATQKAMEILVTLGRIFNASRLIPVASVQISGVSYANLGEAGLKFLHSMMEGGGKARVLTTLNPAGMDIENWRALGISEEFAKNQTRVLEAFARMKVITTCTCTPYLTGNLPHFGEHIAWAESSAVCMANSVFGARTNREGGPSALATSLTGFTPAYGYHLPENRKPTIGIQVHARLTESHEFGALGQAIGKILERTGERHIPDISGVETASLDNLKAFCASIATFGGVALFHMRGITPEASLLKIREPVVDIRTKDIEQAKTDLNNAKVEADFVSLGCPHLSIAEIEKLAALLEGRKVKQEFWVTTSRPVKNTADRMGFTKIIESSGAKFATDTCCVVAPIKGRFETLATDSAKACYYANAKNNFSTRFLSFEDVVEEAVE